MIASSTPTTIGSAGLRVQHYEDTNRLSELWEFTSMIPRWCGALHGIVRSVRFSASKGLTLRYGLRPTQGRRPYYERFSRPNRGFQATGGDYEIIYLNFIRPVLEHASSMFAVRKHRVSNPLPASDKGRKRVYNTERLGSHIENKGATPPRAPRDESRRDVECLGSCSWPLYWSS